MATEIASVFVKLGLNASGLKEGLQQARNETEGFGDTVKRLGQQIITALAVREIWKFGKSIVDAASESEVALLNLRRAVENTGVSFQDAQYGIDRFLQATVAMTGFDDEDASAAIAKLTDITKDYNTALKLMPLAMDMARAENMRLVDSADMLGRAVMGNDMRLQRQLGMLSENTTATQTLAEAQRRYGGYALEYINTQTGAAERLRVVWGNMKETVGTALLPLTSSIATMLGAAGDSVTPQLENISNNIRIWALGLMADFFYWGAAFVQSLANGIAGSSAVVSALNQIGNYFTNMLQAHSPPKLLPNLTKWGAAAMASYLDGWQSATPGGSLILQDWAKTTLEPILKGIDAGGTFTDEQRKGLLGRYGKNTGAAMAEYIDSYSELRKATQGVADAQKEYDEISKSGSEDEIKTAKEKLDKAKAAEKQAKDRHTAASSRLRAEAEAQAQLRRATEQQTQAVRMQTEAIKAQASIQSDAAQKALDAARLAWQMAQTDTAGRIKLLDDESKKYAEGSLEWYQLQTQKINLEKQLQREQEAAAKAGGGGVSNELKNAVADLSVLEEQTFKIKDSLVNIGNGLFIDPLTMQISQPPANLWTLIQNLGRSMAGDFMNKFIGEMWKRLAEALGIDPNATLGDSVTAFGTKLGESIGEALWTALSAKLKAKLDAWMAGVAPKQESNAPRGGSPFPRHELPSAPPGYPDFKLENYRGSGGNNIVINTTNAHGVVLELKRLGAI